MKRYLNGENLLKEELLGDSGHSEGYHVEKIIENEAWNKSWNEFWDVIVYTFGGIGFIFLFGACGSFCYIRYCIRSAAKQSDLVPISKWPYFKVSDHILK